MTVLSDYMHEWPKCHMLLYSSLWSFIVSGHITGTKEKKNSLIQSNLSVKCAFCNQNSHGYTNVFIRHEFF